MIEGGLRCKGVFKNDSDSRPLISYITVVYNRVNTIETCIQSVISQENANFEYIIVDGASSDGTLDVILKYEDKIDYFISEKDTGIYNAMNKGIGLAKGTLVCFMNSDDECLPGAAETATKYYLDSRPDMICGSRILKQDGEPQDEILFKRFPIKHSRFRYIQMFHQSTYATKMLFDRIGGFDEQYTLLADWIWESKAIDEDARICFVHDKLSIFNNDGASFTGIAIRDAEWVQWIRSTFCFLTDSDAWFLLNCLDRDRHPFILLSTIRKISDKYSSDMVFVKTIYETSLCMIHEALQDLEYKYKVNNLDLNDLWKRYSRSKDIEYSDIAQISTHLSALLNSSIADETDNYKYDFPDKVRHFETKAYVIYLKSMIIKPNGLKETLVFFLKKLYLYFSYISGKSVFMSKIFIKVIRNGQILQFAHKIISRKKWKKI